MVATLKVLCSILYLLLVTHVETDFYIHYIPYDESGVVEVDMRILLRDSGSCTWTSFKYLLFILQCLTNCHIHHLCYFPRNTIRGG